MNHPDYSEMCLYDPKKDVYAIPEDWLDWEDENDYLIDGRPSIGDLENAIG